MKPEEAINILIKRLQYFSTKNGINDYVRETTEIVNALLKLNSDFNKISGYNLFLKELFNLTDYLMSVPKDYRRLIKLFFDYQLTDDYNLYILEKFIEHTEDDLKLVISDWIFLKSAGPDLANQLMQFSQFSEFVMFDDKEEIKVIYRERAINKFLQNNNL